ncbi:hypothetical protein pipiens_006347 [Culex pipiens pipiens]|uniref:Uncharacterized protein n=1 Tax=Culex pipiens pipiens TaxID=38569 RepID=A0ABD1DQ05_CULPP
MPRVRRLITCAKCEPGLLTWGIGGCGGGRTATRSSTRLPPGARGCARGQHQHKARGPVDQHIRTSGQLGRSGHRVGPRPREVIPMVPAGWEVRAECDAFGRLTNGQPSGCAIPGAVPGLCDVSGASLAKEQM